MKMFADKSSPFVEMKNLFVSNMGIKDIGVYAIDMCFF